MPTYFIQSERGGPIKIGRTAFEVEERIRDLQTAACEKLILLGTVQTPEREMHKRFEAYRIRGEWFACGSTLAAFVRSEFGIAVQSDPAIAWIRPAAVPNPKPIPVEEAVRRAAGRLWPLRMIPRDEADEWVFDFCAGIEAECRFDEDDGAEECDEDETADDPEGADECDCDRCETQRGLELMLYAHDFLGFVHRKRDDTIFAILRKPQSKLPAIESLKRIVCASQAMDAVGIPFGVSYMPDSGREIPVNCFRACFFLGKKLWKSERTVQKINSEFRKMAAKPSGGSS